MLPDDLPVDQDKLLTWQTECWQCGEQTPIVWPRDDHLNTPIGGVLAKYDTPVERVYSNTLEKRGVGKRLPALRGIPRKPLRGTRGG